MGFAIDPHSTTLTPSRDDQGIDQARQLLLLQSGFLGDQSAFVIVDRDGHSAFHHASQFVAVEHRQRLSGVKDEWDIIDPVTGRMVDHGLLAVG